MDGAAGNAGRGTDGAPAVGGAAAEAGAGAARNADAEMTRVNSPGPLEAGGAEAGGMLGGMADGEDAIGAA